MIRVYPASKRFFTEDGPVGKSYFTFSFDQYFDPTNTAFGPMRVLNDDHGTPGGGIGMHPHRDMEIVSLVIQGGWRHEDSLGNISEIRTNEIQRMTAGKGILHSEYNISKTEWTNAFQMWFSPDEKGLTPSYEKIQVDPKDTHNIWRPVVKKGGGNGTADIHQDLTIYLGQFRPGILSEIPVSIERLGFLMIIRGHMEIVLPNSRRMLLGPRDSARIREESELKFLSGDDCYAMFIDLPKA